MRVCSLLPSSTEILYALGLADEVLGVTHECDFPLEARNKRIVVRSRLPHTADCAEIDRLVREFTARGESIYRVDAEALREIDPDLIITQDLCHVCAASPDDLAAALTVLPRSPKVLSLNPHSLADVWDDICAVGAATGNQAEAQTLVKELKEKVSAVQRAVEPVLRDGARPSVACLEWLNPPYCGGHWVPEMVALAGGSDVLGRAGEPSFRVEWQQVIDAKPDVIVIMPCGFNLQQTMEEISRTSFPPAWQDLPAVKQGRVFAADANSYFSRPGPRLAEGLGILVRAIHPHADFTNLQSGAMQLAAHSF
jgi:iron complex transport system substrate-binding protein